MIAVSATLMTAMLGMAVDLGRMFIVKNELQTFADAAALAACAKLDGSGSGVSAADAIATKGPLGTTVPNGWDFDSKVISNVSTAYATSLNGSYDSAATASAVSPNTYAFVNVTASATLPLYFLPIVSGIPFQYTMSASAVGGQMKQTGGVSGGGLEPFAPEAHNIGDSENFGFTAGHLYTLKWGNGSSTSCSGDLNDPWPTGESSNPPPDHGFVDLGFGNSNSGLRDAIINSDYPQADTVVSSTAPNNTLSAVPGNRGASIFSALATRSAQDSDQDSLNYTAYKAAGKGNGRRLIVVPVSEAWGLGGSAQKGNGNADVTVMGFASFFLAPSSDISGSSGCFCAEYVGRATSWNGPAGASDGTSTYTIALFR
jgi:Flp pilus assembly protein TadG